VATVAQGAVGSEPCEEGDDLTVSAEFGTGSVVARAITPHKSASQLRSSCAGQVAEKRASRFVDGLWPCGPTPGTVGDYTLMWI
jgi:hypothetical protein